MSHFTTVQRRGRVVALLFAVAWFALIDASAARSQNPGAARETSISGGTNDTIGTAAVFSNPAAITINDAAAATPYPSNITVSGLVGNITKLTVTINGFSHTFPDDVDMMLVAPNGNKFVFGDEHHRGARDAPPVPDLQPHNVPAGGRHSRPAPAHEHHLHGESVGRRHDLHSRSDALHIIELRNGVK
jgi:hypothetical protein